MYATPVNNLSREAERCFPLFQRITLYINLFKLPLTNLTNPYLKRYEKRVLNYGIFQKLKINKRTKDSRAETSAYVRQVNINGCIQEIETLNVLL